MFVCDVFTVIELPDKTSGVEGQKGGRNKIRESEGEFSQQLATIQKW